MSFRFDKTEVPQFHYLSVATVGYPRDGCAACHDRSDVDTMTGLCRPCWRVVILGPAMAAARDNLPHTLPGRRL